MKACKKFFGILLSLPVLVTLASCTPPSETQSPSASTAEQETVSPTGTIVTTDPNAPAEGEPAENDPAANPDRLTPVEQGNGDVINWNDIAWSTKEK